MALNNIPCVDIDFSNHFLLLNVALHKLFIIHLIFKKLIKLPLSKKKIFL